MDPATIGAAISLGSALLGNKMGQQNAMGANAQAAQPRPMGAASAPPGPFGAGDPITNAALSTSFGQALLGRPQQQMGGY